MFKDMLGLERGSRIHSKTFFLNENILASIIQVTRLMVEINSLQPWVKGEAQRRLEDANLTKAQKSLETVD